MAELKKTGVKKLGIELYEWFEFRLGLAKPAIEAAEHPVPASSASWWYVFGSAATVLFMLQVMTGILLALVYTPSASQAWNSLQFLNHNVALGWYLRALHGWGSDFMIAIVLIHMVQVFMFGAYKFPRELTWIIGVFLLLLTLGMAFTGQVLRFDQDAYWGLGIGASIMSRVPIVGAPLVHFMLGGSIIGSATLSRFFTLHVFVIPGLLLAGVALHVLMVLRLGINEWPMPGRIVRKSTYEAEYHKLNEENGIPFVPDAAWKDAIFAAAIILAVMACAFFFGPFGPTGQPDPTIIQTIPKPDAPFLWIFAVLSLLPPSLETPIILIAPVIIIGAMLLLPLVAGEGEKHWARRPVAVLMVSVIAVSLGIFTRLGTTTPWSPVMNAWSSDAIPTQYLHERTPLERQGALVFQNKQCRNCHEVGGRGGMRGPALDSIATRLTEDQMVRQVLQGGGNMPAYGNALNPSQTTALVAFLKTLRGNDLRPAQDASRALTRENPPESTVPGEKKPPGQSHLSKKSAVSGNP
ncbi:MAG: cytochrome b N-terminal domain-containing protein [Edaphobacter sp.]